MTGVRKSFHWTQSESFAEAVSTESCHIVLETSPPDYVQKISRYLESSAGQTRQQTVLIDAAEEESDSGDSLFITQKLPEPVRTQRRRRRSLRSTPTSPRDLEESDDATSSSASHEESKTDKKRARKRFRLPKYAFPFLKGTKRKPRSTLLSVRQNTSLHNATMGGFFKCVRELWQGYERGDDPGLSLPTLGMDGEYISPLSEEQEEGSEDEDIKVVEKKRFVAPSKAKCSQPWYTPAKRDSQVTQQRRTTRSKSATSQELSLKNPKKPAKASFSRVTLSSPDTDSSDDGDRSCGGLVERETSDTSILTQTETPKTERHPTRETKKILFRKTARGEELCDDSDATVCEPPKLQRSPGDQALRGHESDVTVTATQLHAFHTDDLSQTGQEEDEPKSQSLLQGHTNNGSVCNETRVKKKKKKKSRGDPVIAEGKGQSQGEEEGLHAAASVNTEADEIPSPQYNRSEAPALSDDNMLRQEEKDIPNSTQTKKKRKKKKSALDNIRQNLNGNLESDARLEDSRFIVTCSLENTNEKMEKKKKRGKSNVEGDDQLQTSAITAEPLHEDGKMQREKKQRKKEKKITVTEECEEVDGVENTEAFEETVECSHEEKRPEHKNKQQASSLKENEDVSLSSDVNCFGHTGLSIKKKKKKKQRISEGVDVSYSPDTNKKVENADSSQKTVSGADDQDVEQMIKKKKKKKDRMSEICSRNNTVGLDDDPGSVRKKRRTSSFLHADSEETNIQHQQQSSSPTASHVWCAENRGVSTGDVETESAEVAGNLSNGVRKKKKKRKTLTTQGNVEVAHEPEFEEPNRKCQSAFSGDSETRLKKKKKHKRTESDCVTPVERLDTRADEGETEVEEVSVPKKKRGNKRAALNEKKHVKHGSPPSETPGNPE